MTIPQHEIDKTISEAQKLEQIKESFKDALKDKFNEEKYNDDLKNGVQITAEDKEKYCKKEQDDKMPPKQSHPQEFNHNGLSFKAHFENGEYIAHGSNGHIIKSKNLNDLNRQIAKTFKVNAFKNHKEVECTFRTPNDPTSNQYKQETEAFARNFINEGVIVKGDLPKDPKFWKNLKNEFLNNNKHTENDWNRLTQAVPNEYKNDTNQKREDQAKTKISPEMMQRFKAMGRI